MLRVSKLTDYATVVLVHLARNPGVQTAPGIAGALGLPEPTVAKVLKLLAGAELVASRRGARGGYRLVRPLRDVAVSDVVVAIDGPVALTACVEGAGAPCELEVNCPVHGRWQPVNDAVRAALSQITLADIMADTPPARGAPVPAYPPSTAFQPALVSP